MVKESQGEKVGWEKSGKLALIKGKVAFLYCGSGKDFIFYNHRSI